MTGVSVKLSRANTQQAQTEEVHSCRYILPLTGCSSGNALNTIKWVFPHTTRLVLRLSSLKYDIFYEDKTQILDFIQMSYLCWWLSVFTRGIFDRSSLSHNVKTFHPNPSEKTEPVNSSGTTVWYCCSSERCPGGVGGREGSLWWIEKAKWRRGHRSPGTGGWNV